MRSHRLSLLLLIFLTPSLHARIIHVPGDESLTIRGGIHRASDGDTVLVSPGTYHEHDIDFMGKSITVTGTDPEDTAVVAATLVDADSLGRIFIFQSGEDTTSVLAGLTLTGGWVERAGGGGITCIENSSPKITRCVIAGNETGRSGGGIHCDGASPIIDQCSIVGNRAAYSGGGILVSRSSSVVRDCVISENYAENDGGGIRCYRTTTSRIMNCVIVRNVAGFRSKGGGIYCYYYSSPMISNCRIEGNASDWGGGGIGCRWNSAPRIENCTITGNTADEGAGIDSYDASPTIVNCLITHNAASFSTGGIRVVFSSSPTTVRNCTLAENYGFRGGGAIGCGEATLIVSNSILWYNGGQPFRVGQEAIIDITYSLVHYPDWPGEGNIGGEPPRFVSREKNDFRLLWESPCIDTGPPDSLDADGTRRDMGVYHFDQNDQVTLYLTPDTTGVQQDQALEIMYTLINRWVETERFEMESDLIFPDSTELTLHSPEDFTLSGETTEQFCRVFDTPKRLPPGFYTYRSRTIFPIARVPGEDRFTFQVYPIPY